MSSAGAAVEGALSPNSHLLTEQQHPCLGQGTNPDPPGDPAPALPNTPTLREGPSAARWAFSTLLLFMLNF